MKYLGIERAALLIAYDNGIINRSESKEDWLAKVEAYLTTLNPHFVPNVDQWLVGLSEEDMEMVCCGEHTEMQPLLEKAPLGTDKFLDEVFEL